TDPNGRTIARCTVGSTDVNKAMVSSGYATAYRHYSADYVPDEERARGARIGLWSGTFQAPDEYRRAAEKAARHPERRTTARAVSQGNCAIKGNRGSNGWIYHLPGRPYYDRTRAEEMFCSEAEAQAAGYRRSRAR
ncbi:MAG TPA: thermonuclease family protein, partial [Sphingomicrobium sp.]|nr:thermonuclease family protein [Sphingomicrobium sp.]